MSGLNQILNTATSTLLGQQKAISIASKNLANVNTAGYQRRTADFEPNGVGGGIAVSELRVEADRYIGGKLLSQNARFGAADASRTILASVDQMFGVGDDGIAGRLDGFFNSLRALETDPANLDLRRDVISTAESFVAKVSGTAQSLEAEQRRADQAIDGMVDEVNDLTRQIAKLNQQISQLGTTGGGGGDLMDKREQLITSLSQKLPLDRLQSDDGSVTLLFDGGHPLVEKGFSATLSATPDAAYGNMRRIDMVGPSGQIREITQKLDTGQLGGILNARDRELPSVIGRLDQLAFDVANAFNAAHNAGFGTDGVSGRDLFVPPGAVAGAARNLALDPTTAQNPGHLAAAGTAATAVGGNDNLQAMLALEDANLAAGSSRTFREEVADVTSLVGRTVRANQQEFVDSRQEIDTLEAMRESEVGVSIDEEMLDIVRFQRAYQAGAKLVQTANTMFDAVINM